MARDFSTNSNRSLRVVGQAMRQSLVSPGMAFRQRMRREADRREQDDQMRLDREILERVRLARRGASTT